MDFKACDFKGGFGSGRSGDRKEGKKADFKAFELIRSQAVPLTLISLDFCYTKVLKSSKFLLHKIPMVKICDRFLFTVQFGVLSNIL